MLSGRDKKYQLKAKAGKYKLGLGASAGTAYQGQARGPGNINAHLNCEYH